jgi:hypothetical protein
MAVTPKNRAAVALGRRGGKARAQNQTVEERIESARRAAQARWAKSEKRIDASLKEMKKNLAKLQAARKKPTQPNK